MRVFLIACLAIVVIAVGAFLTLGAAQKPAGAVYTTDGARISPKWSWRQMIGKPKAAPQTVAMALPAASGALTDDCDVYSAWSWILADFLSTATTDPTCETSH